jgi:hypothetical protein
MRRHLEELKGIFTRTGIFFGEAHLDPDRRGASRFAMRNGLLLAAGLSIGEALAERSLTWTLLAVTMILFLALPVLLLALSALWALFVRAGGRLLSEPIPYRTAFLTVAYSTAGLLPIAFSGVLSWLALAAIPIQVVGLERGLACSRVKSSVLVLFPVSIATLFLLFLALMFEVF